MPRIVKPVFLNASRIVRFFSNELHQVARSPDFPAVETDLTICRPSRIDGQTFGTGTTLQHKSPLFSQGQTVDLAYEKFGPDVGTIKSLGAMVILPGLLSSAELWRALSRAFAGNIQIPIYALSLRNQGASPHIDHMDHFSMAADVLRFCQKHRLKNISLLGHSLGAKVAMALALSPVLPSDVVDNIIIGDSAPVDRPLDSNIPHFLYGMQEIERMNLSSIEEAIEVLQHYTETRLEVKFLLTNLKFKEGGGLLKPIVPLRFRVPIETIRKSVERLGYFPYAPPDARWSGNCLFLKGSDSEFLNSDSISVAKKLFPNMELRTLKGGHWLPFENPKAFVANVVQFLGTRDLGRYSS